MDAYHPEYVVELMKKVTEPVLNVGEEWAEQAMQDGSAPDWQALLAHLTAATASKPSARWDKRARTLVGPLGDDSVRAAAVSWLALVGRPRTLPLEGPGYGADVNTVYDPYNANALRGLAWLVSSCRPTPPPPGPSARSSRPP